MDKKKSYPSFLQKRVEHYYNVKLKSLNAIGSSLAEQPKPDDNAIFLDNNDYLCLADHSEIIEAQIEQLRIPDKSFMSTFFVCDTGPRDQFEIEIAALTKQPTAILSTSGWDINTGLLQTIANHETPLYLDKMVHGSIYMGAYISGANFQIFKHNDPMDLEEKIKASGQGVIVVDSVYSSTGSVCRLAEIAAVSSKYGCVLVVDESHSLGLYGHQGAGMVVELGLEEQVDFITASLSKAFCSRGGIVTCSQRFKDYFRHNSYPSIFSSIVLNHEAKRFLKTLEIIKKDEWRREKLHENTKYLHQHLDNIGFNTELSTSPIISLEVKSEGLAIKLRDLLVERNVVTAPFIPPAVPKKRCNTRMTVNCNLTLPQMDHIVRACKEVLPLVNQL